MKSNQTWKRGVLTVLRSRTALDVVQILIAQAILFCIIFATIFENVLDPEQLQFVFGRIHGLLMSLSFVSIFPIICRDTVVHAHGVDILPYTYRYVGTILLQGSFYAAFRVYIATYETSFPPFPIAKEILLLLQFFIIPIGFFAGGVFLFDHCLQEIKHTLRRP